MIRLVRARLFFLFFTISSFCCTFSVTFGSSSSSISSSSSSSNVDSGRINVTFFTSLNNNDRNQTVVLFDSYSSVWRSQIGGASASLQNYKLQLGDASGLFELTVAGSVVYLTLVTPRLGVATSSCKRTSKELALLVEIKIYSYSAAVYSLSYLSSIYVNVQLRNYYGGASSSLRLADDSQPAFVAECSSRNQLKQLHAANLDRLGQLEVRGASDSKFERYRFVDESFYRYFILNELDGHIDIRKRENSSAGQPLINDDLLEACSHPTRSVSQLLCSRTAVSTNESVEAGQNQCWIAIESRDISKPPSLSSSLVCVHVASLIERTGSGLGRGLNDTRAYGGNSGGGSDEARLSVEYIFKLSNESSFGFIKDDMPVNGIIGIVRISSGGSNRSEQVENLRLTKVRMIDSSSQTEEYADDRFVGLFSIKKFLSNFYMVRLAKDPKELFKLADLSGSVVKLMVNASTGPAAAELTFKVIQAQNLQIKFAQAGSGKSERAALRYKNVRSNSSAFVHLSSLSKLNIKLSEQFELRPSLKAEEQPRDSLNEGGLYICGLKAMIDSSLFIDDLLTPLNYERSFIRYTTVQSNLADWFDLDPVHGHLTLRPNASLDRELIVGVAKSPVVWLNISAVDSQKLFKSAYLSVNLNVLDLNDNAPVYQSNRFTVEVDELDLNADKTNSTHVQVFEEEAEDADADDNAALEYLLTSVERQTDSNQSAYQYEQFFRVNATTGALWMSREVFSLRRWLTSQSPFEPTVDIFSVRLTCKDKGQPVFRYGQTVVDVYVRYQASHGFAQASPVRQFAQREYVKADTYDYLYEVDLSVIEIAGHMQIGRIPFEIDSVEADVKPAGNATGLEDHFKIKLRNDGAIVLHMLRAVKSKLLSKANYIQRTLKLIKRLGAGVAYLNVYVRVNGSDELGLRFDRPVYRFKIDEDFGTSDRPVRRLIGKLGSSCRSGITGGGLVDFELVDFKAVNSNLESFRESVFAIELDADGAELNLFSVRTLDYELQQTLQVDILSKCSFWDDERRRHAHLMRTRVVIELVDLNDNLPRFVYPVADHQTFYQQIRLTSASDSSKYYLIADLKALDLDMSEKNARVAYKVLEFSKEFEDDQAPNKLDSKIILNEINGSLYFSVDARRHLIDPKAAARLVVKFTAKISAFNYLDPTDVSTLVSLNVIVDVTIDSLVVRSVRESISLVDLLVNGQLLSLDLVEKLSKNSSLVNSQSQYQVRSCSAKRPSTAGIDQLYMGVQNMRLLMFRRGIAETSVQRIMAEVDDQEFEMECQIVENARKMLSIFNSNPSEAAIDLVPSVLTVSLSASPSGGLQTKQAKIFHVRSNAPIHINVDFDSTELLRQSRNLYQLDPLFDFNEEPRSTTDAEAYEKTVYIFELAQNDLNNEFVKRRFRVGSLSGVLSTNPATGGAASDASLSAMDREILSRVQTIQMNVELSVYELSGNTSTLQMSLARKSSCMVYLHLEPSKPSETTLKGSILNVANYESGLNEMLGRFSAGQLIRRELKFANETSGLFVVNLVDPYFLQGGGGVNGYQVRAEIKSLVEIRMDASDVDLVGSKVFEVTQSAELFSYKYDLVFRAQNLNASSFQRRRLYSIQMEICVYNDQSEFNRTKVYQIVCRPVSLSVQIDFGLGLDEITFARLEDTLDLSGFSSSPIEARNHLRPVFRLTSLISNAQLLDLDQLVDSALLRFKFVSSPSSSKHFYLDESSGSLFLTRPSELLKSPQRRPLVLEFDAFLSNKYLAGLRLRVTWTRSSESTVRQLSLDLNDTSREWFAVSSSVADPLAVVCVSCDQAWCRRLLVIDQGRLLLNSTAFRESRMSSVQFLLESKSSSERFNLSVTDSARASARRPNSMVVLRDGLSALRFVEPNELALRLFLTTNNRRLIESRAFELVRVRNLLTNTEVIALDYQLLYTSLASRPSCHLAIQNVLQLESDQIYSFDFARRPSKDEAAPTGPTAGSIFLIRPSSSFESSLKQLAFSQQIVRIKKLLSFERAYGSSIANLSRIEADYYAEMSSKKSLFSNIDQEVLSTTASQFIQSVFVLNRVSTAASNLSLVDYFRVDSNGHLYQADPSLRLDLFPSVEVSAYKILASKLTLKIFKIIEFDLRLELFNESPESPEVKPEFVSYYEHILLRKSDIVLREDEESRHYDVLVADLRSKLAASDQEKQLTFQIDYAQIDLPVEVEPTSGRVFYLTNSDKFKDFDQFMEKRFRFGVSACDLDWRCSQVLVDLRIADDEPLVLSQGLLNKFQVFRSIASGDDELLVGQIDLVSALNDAKLADQFATALATSNISIAFEVASNSSVFRLDKSSGLLFAPRRSLFKSDRHSLLVYARGRLFHKEFLLAVNCLVKVASADFGEEPDGVGFDSNLLKLNFEHQFHGADDFSVRLSRFELSSVEAQNRARFKILDQDVRGLCVAHLFNPVVHCQFDLAFLCQKTIYELKLVSFLPTETGRNRDSFVHQIRSIRIDLKMNRRKHCISSSKKSTASIIAEPFVKADQHELNIKLDLSNSRVSDTVANLVDLFALGDVFDARKKRVYYVRDSKGRPDQSISRFFELDSSSGDLLFSRDDFPKADNFVFLSDSFEVVEFAPNGKIRNVFGKRFILRVAASVVKKPTVFLVNEPRDSKVVNSGKNSNESDASPAERCEFVLDLVAVKSWLASRKGAKSLYKLGTVSYKNSSNDSDLFYYFEISKQTSQLKSSLKLYQLSENHPLVYHYETNSPPSVSSAIIDNRNDIFMLIDNIQNRGQISVNASALLELNVFDKNFNVVLMRANASLRDSVRLSCKIRVDAGDVRQVASYFDYSLANTMRIEKLVDANSSQIGDVLVDLSEFLFKQKTSEHVYELEDNSPTPHARLFKIDKYNGRIVLASSLRATSARNKLTYDLVVWLDKSLRVEVRFFVKHGAEKLAVPLQNEEENYAYDEIQVLKMPDYCRQNYFIGSVNDVFDDEDAGASGLYRFELAGVRNAAFPVRVNETSGGLYCDYSAKKRGDLFNYSQSRHLDLEVLVSKRASRSESHFSLLKTVYLSVDIYQDNENRKSSRSAALVNNEKFAFDLKMNDDLTINSKIWSLPYLITRRFRTCQIIAGNVRRTFMLIKTGDLYLIGDHRADPKRAAFRLSIRCVEPFGGSELSLMDLEHRNEIEIELNINNQLSSLLSNGQQLVPVFERPLYELNISLTDFYSSASAKVLAKVAAGYHLAPGGSDQLSRTNKDLDIVYDFSEYASEKLGRFLRVNKLSGQIETIPSGIEAFLRFCESYDYVIRLESSLHMYLKIEARNFLNHINVSSSLLRIGLNCEHEFVTKLPKFELNNYVVNLSQLRVAPRLDESSFGHKTTITDELRIVWLRKYVDDFYGTLWSDYGALLRAPRVESDSEIVYYLCNNQSTLSRFNVDFKYNLVEYLSGNDSGSSFFSIDKKTGRVLYEGVDGLPDQEYSLKVCALINATSFKWLIESSVRVVPNRSSESSSAGSKRHDEYHVVELDLPELLLHGPGKRLFNVGDTIRQDASDEYEYETANEIGNSVVSFDRETGWLSLQGRCEDGAGSNLIIRLRVFAYKRATTGNSYRSNTSKQIDVFLRFKAAGGRLETEFRPKTFQIYADYSSVKENEIVFDLNNHYKSSIYKLMALSSPLSPAIYVNKYDGFVYTSRRFSRDDLGSCFDHDLSLISAESDVNFATIRVCVTDGRGSPRSLAGQLLPGSGERVRAPERFFYHFDLRHQPTGLIGQTDPVVDTTSGQKAEVVEVLCSAWNQTPTNASRYVGLFKAVFNEQSKRIEVRSLGSISSYSDLANECEFVELKIKSGSRLSIVSLGLIKSWFKARSEEKLAGDLQSVYNFTFEYQKSTRYSFNVLEFMRFGDDASSSNLDLALSVNDLNGLVVGFEFNSSNGQLEFAMANNWESAIAPLTSYRLKLHVVLLTKEDSSLFDELRLNLFLPAVAEFDSSKTSNHSVYFSRDLVELDFALPNRKAPEAIFNLASLLAVSSGPSLKFNLIQSGARKLFAVDSSGVLRFNLDEMADGSLDKMRFTNWTSLINVRACVVDQSRRFSAPSSNVCDTCQIRLRVFGNVDTSACLRSLQSNSKVNIEASASSPLSLFKLRNCGMEGFNYSSYKIRNAQVSVDTTVGLATLNGRAKNMNITVQSGENTRSSFQVALKFTEAFRSEEVVLREAQEDDHQMNIDFYYRIEALTTNAQLNVGYNLGNLKRQILLRSREIVDLAWETRFECELWSVQDAYYGNSRLAGFLRLSKDCDLFLRAESGNIVSLIEYLNENRQGRYTDLEIRIKDRLLQHKSLFLGLKLTLIEFRNVYNRNRQPAFNLPLGQTRQEFEQSQNFFIELAWIGVDSRENALVDFYENFVRKELRSVVLAVNDHVGANETSLLIRPYDFDVGFFNRTARLVNEMYKTIMARYGIRINRLLQAFEKHQHGSESFFNSLGGSAALSDLGDKSQSNRWSLTSVVEYARPIETQSYVLNVPEFPVQHLSSDSSANWSSSVRFEKLNYVVYEAVDLSLYNYLKLKFSFYVEDDSEFVNQFMFDAQVDVSTKIGRRASKSLSCLITDSRLIVRHNLGVESTFEGFYLNQQIESRVWYQFELQLSEKGLVVTLNRVAESSDSASEFESPAEELRQERKFEGSLKILSLIKLSVGASIDFSTQLKSLFMDQIQLSDLRLNNIDLLSKRSLKQFATEVHLSSTGPREPHWTKCSRNEKNFYSSDCNYALGPLKIQSPLKQAPARLLIEMNDNYRDLVAFMQRAQKWTAKRMNLTVNFEYNYDFDPAKSASGYVVLAKTPQLKLIFDFRDSQVSLINAESDEVLASVAVDDQHLKEQTTIDSYITHKLSVLFSPETKSVRLVLNDLDSKKDWPVDAAVFDLFSSSLITVPIGLEPSDRVEMCINEIYINEEPIALFDGSTRLYHSRLVVASRNEDDDDDDAELVRRKIYSCNNQNAKLSNNDGLEFLHKSSVNVRYVRAILITTGVCVLVALVAIVTILVNIYSRSNLRRKSALTSSSSNCTTVGTLSANGVIVNSCSPRDDNLNIVDSSQIMISASRHQFEISVNTSCNDNSPNSASSAFSANTMMNMMSNSGSTGLHTCRSELLSKLVHAQSSSKSGNTASSLNDVVTGLENNCFVYTDSDMRVNDDTAATANDNYFEYDTTLSRSQQQLQHAKSNNIRTVPQLLTRSSNIKAKTGCAANESATDSSTAASSSTGKLFGSNLYDITENIGFLKIALNWQPSFDQFGDVIQDMQAIETTSHLLKSRSELSGVSYPSTINEIYLNPSLLTTNMDATANSLFDSQRQTGVHQQHFQQQQNHSAAAGASGDNEGNLIRIDIDYILNANNENQTFV